MSRVGQNRIYTPYKTVYLVISLPKIPYIHRIYMVLANPSNEPCTVCVSGHVVYVPGRTLRSMAVFCHACCLFVGGCGAEANACCSFVRGCGAEANACCSFVRGCGAEANARCSFVRGCGAEANACSSFVGGCSAGAR